MRIPVFAIGLISACLSRCDDNVSAGNGSLTIEGGYQGTYLHSNGSVDFVFISTITLDWKKSGTYAMETRGGRPNWAKGYQCGNGASYLWRVGDGEAEVAGQSFDLSDGEFFVMKSDFSVVQIDAQFEELADARLLKEVAELYNAFSEQGATPDG